MEFHALQLRGAWLKAVKDVCWHRRCLEWGMASSSPIPDAARQLTHTRQAAHPFCFVCSGSNPMGLALRYAPQPDGSVSATFLGNCALEGYAGLLHGGVIAALLDGAMTNCLFARGLPGLTAELKVRYHASVVAAEEMFLRAWLEDDSHGLYQLRAELTQSGTVRASATGKFMMCHE
jgi:acyl-coenzyme A thioesterase PaaI-like protein